MKVQATAFPDLCSVHMQRFADARGYFSEAYNAKHLAHTPLRGFQICQVNQSFSQKHVFRGFHFQRTPYAQAKMVQALKGAVCDYALDLRQGSPTYLKVFAMQLDDTKSDLLFIPKGFAHGFLVLSHVALVQYFVDAPYQPSHEGGVNYEDAALKMDWPVQPPFGRSKRDAQWGSVSEAAKLFTF